MSWRLERKRRPNRYPLGLHAGLAGLFGALFGGELLLDLHHAAERTGRPLAEVWPSIEGSWLSAAQAGSCLARAGYSMLAICVSMFVLSIPLAATFHTPKLMEVYLRDRVNRAIFALGILTSGVTHFQTTITWPSIAADAAGAGFYSPAALWSSVALVAVAWAAILPYALYALRFLDPAVVIESLERAARRELRRGGSAARLRRDVADLGTITARAVERGDRDLALDGVKALGRVLAYSIRKAPALASGGFAPERAWFAGVSDEAWSIIEGGRIWFAHLLFRELWIAYATALRAMPDAAGQIATVKLAVAAEAGGPERGALVDLALRFANTTLHEAIERGDALLAQDVARAHRQLVARVAGVAADPAAVFAEAADHLADYTAEARERGSAESADVVMLSLARLAELAIARGPAAVAGVARAIDRLERGARPSGAPLKAAVLVASCLDEAGAAAGEGGTLATRIAGAERGAREALRGSLLATDRRAEAGREAYGAEPGLEFIAGRRREAMLAVLARAGE